MSRPSIITNFAYGTGPYLRTTDLAIAFNDELADAGRQRHDIIVPWVYGEKQRRVMLQEFSGHEKKYPGEILLDKTLGEILHGVFYADSTYEEALAKWTDTYQDASEQAARHLTGRFECETFGGKRVMEDSSDIAVELGRSPRIRYDAAPAYFTSFAYVGEILERAQGIKEIAVDRELLKKGVDAANWVEAEQTMRAIAYPATFAYLGERTPRYGDEMLVPPIAPPPKPNQEPIDPGIFVTITGIPGLERLYGDARRLGLKLYSNEPDTVPGSNAALPHIIPNQNIVCQFARAGWSSIWISMISGTPLVVPDFDPRDDPEIYFNNKSVEKLGLGIIYRGQPLEEILKEVPRIKIAYENMKNDILARWGTLDGNRYCAQKFTEHFLATF